MAKDEPGDELLPRGESYRPLDLEALSTSAETRHQRLWDMAVEAMYDAEPVAGEPWKISLGVADVKFGKRRKSFTLLQRDNDDFIYLVPTERKRPSDALLSIGAGGAMPVDDFNNTLQSFDPNEVLKLIEPISLTAAAKRRDRQYDREVSRRKRRRNIRNGILGVTIPIGSVSAVIALIWLLAGAFSGSSDDGYTTQAIKTKYTYAADGRFHVVHWSEQFDGANIKTLIDDQNAIVPFEPRAVDGENLDAFDGNCDTTNRDVRVGDKFRAVFSGQGGDGFKIKLDPRDNTVEICRTASQDTPQGSNQHDTIVLQQVR